MAQNIIDIIDNGIDHFYFAPNHVVINVLESVSILTNLFLRSNTKIEVLYNLMLVLVLFLILNTTHYTSKIQLLKLCSQAEVPLHFLNQISSGLLPHQKQEQISIMAGKLGRNT